MAAASRTALDLARRRRLPAPGRIGFIAIPVGFLTLVAILVVAGEAITPHDPGQQRLLVALAPPGGDYLLGTDDLGRDVLSRLMAGARSSVVGPLLVATGSMLLGNALGLLSGYASGRVDAVIMRWVDFMWSIPSLFVAIVAVGVLGGGYFLAVVVLIGLYAPYDTRLIRGATLAQRQLPYVEAAQTLGLSSARIMGRHILPNVLPLTIANAFLNFAYAMLSLAGLTFLGLGSAPGAADWGRMLAEGREYMYDNPAVILGASVMVVLTAVSMNLVGDWVNERFADRGRAR